MILVSLQALNNISLLWQSLSLTLGCRPNSFTSTALNQTPSDPQNTPHSLLSCVCVSQQIIRSVCQSFCPWQNYSSSFQIHMLLFYREREKRSLPESSSPAGHCEWTPSSQKHVQIISHYTLFINISVHLVRNRCPLNIFY